MELQLVAIHPYPSPQSIPLANAFLKAFARNSPVSILLTDFYLGQDAAACAEQIAANKPVAVGFSLYVWNRDLCCEIASQLRYRYPSFILFCGGPEASADAGSIFSQGVFDFVIPGEGEAPFLSLCNVLAEGSDFSGIPGLLLPGVPVTSSPPPISDLDTIPSPYLTGIIDTRATPGLLWQLSRGCSFTCDFCFDARGVHGVRHFSLERVEAELRHFAASGVSQIFVLDSTFNMDRDRAKKILRLIKKLAPAIHFHFEVRSEFIDREMAGLFAQITCSLQIGLQSAHPEILKLVGRTFNRKDFTAKAGLLNESGAVFGFDLMYGLPGDTLAGFCQSLDYALSLYPNHLDIFPLAVLPGTRLAAAGASLKLSWDVQPPYLLKHTDTFSAADMAAAADLAAGCDIFYTRGKSVAWFNAVVALLNIKPSAFLSLFSTWLIGERGRGIQEADLSDDDIQELQQHFLSYLLRERKLHKYLPLVRDLVTYHHLYASVLLADSRDSSSASESSCSGLKLASSSRLAHFTYDIEELLACGEPRLRWMFENLAPVSSHAVIYLNEGMVCTEPLDKAYFTLLEIIRDNVTGDFAKAGLSHNEVDEFVEFARQEGIVVAR